MVTVMKTTTDISITEQVEAADSLPQLKAGFIANLVVAASVAAYGSVLGLIAAKKGLSWVELLVMNLSVFAGSAQFVMVDMWLPPLPMAEITLAVKKEKKAEKLVADLNEQLAGVSDLSQYGIENSQNVGEAT